MNYAIEGLRTDTDIDGSRLNLLYFTAQWCAPCKQLGPSMAMLTQAYKSEVQVVKVDADENVELMKSFGLRAIPALVLVREGRPLDELIGLQPYHDLTKWLDSHLSTEKD